MAHDPRHDKTKRRKQLRRLDLVLAAEILDAGSMSIEELHLEVRTRKLLSERLSEETLCEWWTYARHRQILSRSDTNGRVSLTERGRDELEALQQDWQDPTLIGTLVRVLKWMAPSGIAVLAALSLTQENEIATDVLVAIGVFLVMAIPTFWLADQGFRTSNQRADRKLMDRIVKWLEGDEVRMLLRKLPPATPQRLYSPTATSHTGNAPPRKAPGPSNDHSPISA